MRPLGRSLALCLGLAALMPPHARAAPGAASQAATAAHEKVLAEAERAYAHGDLKRARHLLDPLVKAKQPRALALQGQLLASQGQAQQANALFHRVIELYNAGAISDDDGLGMWSVAEAARGLGAVRDANLAFTSAVRAAPDNLAIELAWAELFLEKNDFANAQAGLLKILARDPNYARALERLARVRLEHNAPAPEVETLLERALSSDPELGAAYVTRAGIALRDEDLSQADQQLNAALERNPRDLEALSVRAAVRFLADDKPGFERAVARVLAENPRFSRMYSIIATYAEWEHRYEDLVTLSEQAIKLDPEDAYAYATRGLNLLRVGREREGLDALQSAWSRDHYNVQVFNTLNLYDEVIAKEYVSFDAPPFKLRTHRDERAILTRYAVPMLEQAYADMRERYQFSPANPTWIELYANPEQFSVRTSGLPRLGLQGVCFGRVLTALSPRGGEFNWGQILWHELSHVFHVQLSKSRVPRWFTEGLAEYETKRARPDWKREDDRPLYDALMAGSLPPLAQLNHAFTHARDPQALMVAYYASALAVEHMVERFGFAKVSALLAAFGQGLESEQAFQQSFGMGLEALDREFRAALHARLDARYAHDLRIDLALYRDPERSAQAAAAASATPRARGAHALALAVAAQEGPARELAQSVLKETPNQPEALFALAHLVLKHGDAEGGRVALEAMLAQGLDGYQLRMLLARAEQKLGHLPRALEHLSRAEAIDPERSEAYEFDAKIAEVAGDRAREKNALLQVSFLDQHARAPLMRLLKLLSEQHDYALLAARSEAGLYIDPENPELHRLRAEALAALKGPQAGIEEAEVALTLANDEAQRKHAMLTLSQLRAGAKLAPEPGLTPKAQAKPPVSR